MAVSRHHTSIDDLEQTSFKVDCCVNPYKYLNQKSDGILDDDKKEEPKVFPFGLHRVQHWLGRTVDYITSNIRFNICIMIQGDFFYWYPL